MLKELLWAPVDIYINQGNTFYKQFTLTDNTGGIVDLTPLTITAEIKRYKNSGTLYTLVPVVISATAGTFALTMTNTVSQTLTYSRYTYSVNVSNGTDNVKIMHGAVLVTNF
jgi:hypothetical protein